MHHLMLMSSSNTCRLKSAAVKVKAPELGTCKNPVPTITLSARLVPSNKHIVAITTFVTIRESVVCGVPVVPVASSKNGLQSLCSLTVVVLPFTVKSPVTTALPLTVTLLAVISSNGSWASTLRL